MLTSSVPIPTTTTANHPHTSSSQSRLSLKHNNHNSSSIIAPISIDKTTVPITPPTRHSNLSAILERASSGSSTLLQTRSSHDLEEDEEVEEHPPRDHSHSEDNEETGGDGERMSKPSDPLSPLHLDTSSTRSSDGSTRPSVGEEGSVTSQSPFSFGRRSNTIHKHGTVGMVALLFSRLKDFPQRQDDFVTNSNQAINVLRRILIPTTQPLSTPQTSSPPAQRVDSTNFDGIDPKQLESVV